MDSVTKGRLLMTAAMKLEASNRPKSASVLIDQVVQGKNDLPTLRRLSARRNAFLKERGGQGARPTAEAWQSYGITAADKPRALSILDEISELNWSTDFECTRLNRSTAQTQAEDLRYDFVLMESAWRAHNDDWLYAFTSPNRTHANAKALTDVLSLLRELIDKPIVMINKEDPLHFDKFLPVMKYADHIFTTDEEMVPKYLEHTDALSVTALPFAANLKFTNPVDRIREPQEDLCFAGSYYSQGHEERARQMNYMLEPIVEFKGAIYDRMSVHENPRYHFPERFRPFIRPAVDFKEMTSLYRRFKVFLNVNTIISSPTMMSRRVYELLASGTPVVSAPSKSLEEQFSGIVPMATSAGEAVDQVGRLLNDNRHWWKTSQLGIREVTLKHQYTHRSDVIRYVVLGQETKREAPLVSIILSTRRWRFLDRIVESISKQTYSRIEVIFALRDDWPPEKVTELENRLTGVGNIERVNIMKFPSTVSLGNKLNAAINTARGEFVSKFDDDDWYFPNYLQDMMLTFDFSGADLCGKRTFPVWLEGSDTLILRNPGHEHKITNFVCGASFVAKKSWFKKIPFANQSQGEDTNVLKRTLEVGGKIYSADHFNFINYRAADTQHHTWRAEDDLFKRTGKVVGKMKDFHNWVV